MEDSVRAFHRAFGLPAPERFDPSADLEARARLIMEEAHELLFAMGLRQDDVGVIVPNGRGADWPAVAHELADLLYVTLGTAVAIGFPVSRFFHAVHLANMAKVGGTVDQHGKLRKPTGWTPAPTREMWARMVAR